MPIHPDIQTYNTAQSAGDKRICDALAKAIDRHLPDAESKIWHRHPVWFLEGNPIVGYSKLKDSIRLLFWSGQSFDEPGLEPEGTFKAAEARYTSDDQIAARDLKRWLEKSIEIQWDYKNIVKRKGRLERMQKATTPLKKSGSGSAEGKGGDSSSQRIDARFREPSDWRSETLTRIRNLIKQADPEVVEEVKWRKPSNGMQGVPVWSHGGIICTGETYKNVVKMTFAKGASLPDPSGLFNSSLEGNTRRAIDFHEGDTIDKKALQALIRAAVALNTSAPALARAARSQKRSMND
jgi:hypothetical protein